MDQSNVGKLNHGADIKRKTKKIHYRKSKGRLNTKSSGILNKSVYKLNASKSFNDTAHSKSQLVALHNINSFLTKNRELAKALEECRQRTKDLEKEKFTYQLDFLEMKEKLNNFQVAALTCSCSKLNVPPDKEALFNLKNHINQSVVLMNSFLQMLTNQNETDITEDNNSSDNKFRPVTHNVGTQAILITSPVDSSIQPQSASKPIKKETRNKKLQVDLPSRSCNGSSCNQSLEKTSKNKTQEVGVQCTPVTNNSVAVQCSLMKQQQQQQQQQNDEKLLKKSQRKPLNVLTQNGSNIQKTQTSEEKLKKTKKSPFNIYSDELNKENVTQRKRATTTKKSVTICSQKPEIHYYEVLSPHYDHRLRPRNIHRNYKEPTLNTKPSTVDHFDLLNKDEFKLKKKIKRGTRKRRASQNPSIAIEDIISLVEESFIAGQASARESNF